MQAWALHCAYAASPSLSTSVEHVAASELLLSVSLFPLGSFSGLFLTQKRLKVLYPCTLKVRAHDVTIFDGDGRASKEWSEGLERG